MRKQQDKAGANVRFVMKWKLQPPRPHSCTIEHSFTALPGTPSLHCTAHTGALPAPTTVMANHLISLQHISSLHLRAVGYHCPHLCDTREQ